MKMEQLYTQMQNKTKTFIYTVYRVQKATQTSKCKLIVLNVKLKVIKLLPKNVGEALCNFMLGIYFIDTNNPFLKKL